MSRRQASSQPIKIAASSPQHYPIIGGSSHDEDEDDDSDHHHDIQGDSYRDVDLDVGRYQQHQHQHQHQQHHGHQNQLNSTFSNLTVGSLPSSRRERRFMVSSNNHEFYTDRQRSQGGNGGVGGGGLGVAFDRYQQHPPDKIGAHTAAVHRSRLGQLRRDSSNTNNGMPMSSSMPVPSAPFLASRKDQASGERLSKIPKMQLPESASESYSTATTIPHGSLNESQFRYPNRTQVRFSDTNGNANVYNNNNSLSNNNNNNASSTSLSSLADRRISQSYQNPYNIQQRVEDMRRSGGLIKNETKSGLAALLGDNAAAADAVSTHRGDDNNSHRPSNGHGNSSDWGIGAVMNGVGASRNEVGEDMYDPNQQQSIPVPSSIKFGSTSTHTSMLTTPHQNQSISVSHIDSDPLVSSATGSEAVPNNGHNNNNHINFNDQNYNSNAQNNDELQLSGSLTGLDILKNTRVLTTINSEEVKAMLDIQARSRSYSDDIGCSLQGTNIVPQNHHLNQQPLMSSIIPDMVTSTSSQEQEMQMHYHNPGGGFQRRFSNSSEHSLNNDAMGSYDHDMDGAFGAFDLDMDC